MKKTLSTIALAAVMLMAAPGASGASREAIRINEVMVVNDNSMVDEYGQRQAWIELFNANFAPIEISSI
ncbi:MAG: lamin tail domain-containing protein, partial [Muribaculaceae bacterium]|nr:lamin tail domain-containing protein [Muribaculaceae bacterium]